MAQATAADRRAGAGGAGDGLDLVSYLTLPLQSDPDGDGRPSEPVPMVLFVHGGPWGRGNWGYNSYHQWLVNRDYAVLSVNFRGSTGLGKDFTNAGDMEWAGEMHDDLIDAVDWAVSKGHHTRRQGRHYGRQLRGLLYASRTNIYA